jgi:AcrR family transcriptional regulator
MRTTAIETRSSLLRAAFDEIQLNGFHAASLESILKCCKLTKGALYHHFSSKQGLGLAVIREIIGPHLEQWYIKPLETNEDPLAGVLMSFDPDRVGKRADLRRFG